MFSAIVTYIQNSYAHLVENEWVILTLLVILIFIELAARKIKKSLKRKIFSQYDGSTDPEDSEYYLTYYRKSQIIDLIRALSFIVFLSFLLVSK
jgi:hypothetical protein